MSRIEGIYKILCGETNLLLPTENISEKIKWWDMANNEYIGYPHHDWFKEPELKDKFINRLNNMKIAMENNKVIIFRSIVEDYDLEIQYLEKIRDLLNKKNIVFKFVILIATEEHNIYRLPSPFKEAVLWKCSYYNSIGLINYILENIDKDCWNNSDLIEDNSFKLDIDYKINVRRVLRFWEKKK